jgi:hypothetical protein
MKTHAKIDDMEMIELIKAAYPNHYNQIESDDVLGIDDIAVLLGRIVMMTIPVEPGMTKRLSHCLELITTIG